MCTRKGGTAGAAVPMELMPAYATAGAGVPIPPRPTASGLTTCNAGLPRRLPAILWIFFPSLKMLWPAGSFCRLVVQGNRRDEYM